MQAIEFEATAQNHIIHLPNSIPDGVNLRVLVLLDESVTPPDQTRLNTLLTNLTEGLTGEDLAKSHNVAQLTAASAFGLVKTTLTATLEDIEQGIVAGATRDND
ncbi:MAG: hypothetical protein PHH59_03725 [Methylovulum sp.]|uniref:hypothetical protein n=1 Tax=Methylovulum sp. TaxID=1916980 RepID=UPI002637B3C3|nr:hypothetical protein [Methylovulum sp.]MDD2723117.1 hypothetical protein [Methylovulum sp.]MDD5124830.1 hypothetical protein [Methylovulum sp.]